MSWSSNHPAHQDTDRPHGNIPDLGCDGCPLCCCSNPLHAEAWRGTRCPVCGATS